MKSTWRQRAFIPLIGLAVMILGACSPTEPVEGPQLDAKLVEKYRAGLVEGKEKYSEVGSMYQGDVRWKCPLRKSVEAAGIKAAKHTTVVGQPAEGVYALECEFYEGVPVHLSFIEAQNEAELALVGVSLKVYSAEDRPEEYSGQDVAQELIDILQS